MYNDKIQTTIRCSMMNARIQVDFKCEIRDSIFYTETLSMMNGFTDVFILVTLSIIVSCMFPCKALQAFLLRLMFKDCSFIVLV